MKIYILSLGAGILVGIIYGIIGVRSRAPPVVALVGLLGILVGEQVVPLIKRVAAGEPITVRWVKTECVPHIFVELPTKAEPEASSPDRKVRS